ncbi:hypothetical protein [Coprococcus comes]|uniref:hypothetical protein n=1 Tax=Coprococcus comes TaxID=410072 RepID=UPI00189CCEA8|nr:hypothetical protein [Coprococcus comes]MDC0797519.1 hypothetical protein [Coprococcus comes]
MVLDMFRYEGVEVVVSYFPVWEMFFSMHVLSNPEHHLTRRKWVEAKEKSYPDGYHIKASHHALNPEEV